MDSSVLGEGVRYRSDTRRTRARRERQPPVSRGTRVGLSGKHAGSRGRRSLNNPNRFQFHLDSTDQGSDPVIERSNCSANKAYGAVDERRQHRNYEERNHAELVLPVSGGQTYEVNQDKIPSDT